MTLIAASLLTLGLNGTAVADGGALYQAKGCASCHGADGNSPTMGMSSSKLGGQVADYTAAQMKDIKSGARANGNAGMMKGVMSAITDDEIEAIAEWLEGSE